MAASPAQVRFAAFRRLLDHAGWQVLATAPGDDAQGPDLRERIGKDGVVFSAYPIPRGGSHFGRVDLDPLPAWARSSGLSCDIPVEELCDRLGFAGDPQGSFEFLDSRLEDVKAYLRGGAFARTKLDRAIVLVKQRTAAHSDLLHELRPQLGLLALMKTLIRSRVFHYHELRRYRRALRSLGEDLGSGSR